MNERATTLRVEKRGMYLFKRVTTLMLISAGFAFMAEAQVGPTTFLKLKHEIGRPHIVDRATFTITRNIQDQVITVIGGHPALTLKHPVAGIRCHACHPGTPKGPQHDGVALNEADPSASCGACHVTDLFERLSRLPYFTELRFQLTDATSVADAETRVDNAVAWDGVMDLSDVVTNASEAKWEFEVQRLPSEPGGFPEFFNGLLDKTATALQMVKANHVTTPAVSPELEVKVEAKAFSLDRARVYVREFGVLDDFVSALVSKATPERNVEAKWVDPALPYDTAYTFIRETISAQFGTPAEVRPDLIVWELGGGARIKAEFKHPEDNFTHETKVRFEKIFTTIEDEAFDVLHTIVAQYPSFNLNESKIEHKYRLKNATTAENALLIDTLETYTASTPLPDKEFKYEVKVKKGTDVFTDLLEFFAAKRADHPGALVKTKTELKWHPLDPTNYEYKVEVVAAERP
ncbi:MAG: hypothetical protein D6723_11235 [Acidobacteria bacterium]|nr:MAG: hypothetical protein D6723_11235 [Acidobacteriota bacterium]